MVNSVDNKGVMLCVASDKEWEDIIANKSDFIFRARCACAYSNIVNTVKAVKESDKTELMLWPL